MERIIVTSIVIILTSVSLSFLISSIWKTNVNEVISNLGKDHIIVHLPNAYKWVGLASTSFFAILFISSQYLYTETRSIFTDVGFLFFVFLGFFLSYSAYVWRIDVYKSRDYFVIRNSFWVTKKAYYSEVTHYTRYINNLRIYSKKKTLRIDKKATNIEFLLAEFSKHKIHEKRA